MAAAPAERARFQPTDEQVDRSWQHIAQLCRENPDRIPRSLHEQAATHNRLLGAVRGLGDGDRRAGWRRVVELRQRACGLLTDEGTPVEWVDVYKGGPR